jgi:hypothetical protein
LELETAAKKFLASVKLLPGAATVSFEKSKRSIRAVMNGLEPPPK